MTGRRILAWAILAVFLAVAEVGLFIAGGISAVVAPLVLAGILGAGALLMWALDEVIG